MKPLRKTKMFLHLSHRIEDEKAKKSGDLYFKIQRNTEF